MNALSPLDPVSLLFAQAQARPDHAAVREGGRDLSYGELAALVRRYAHAFAEAAAEPRVAIHLPRGAHAYAAMFGAMLAGGFYVPLNNEAPPARIQTILDDVQPDILVATAADHAVLAADPAVRRLAPDTLPAAELATARPAADLAYVIFTSGSTGKPKGVMVPRGGLAHYVAWVAEAMAPSPEDRWSQHPNIGFDLSVLDIYGALCHGATLCPLTGNKHRLLPGEAIRELNLTIWDSVPSVLDMIAQARHMTPRHLASVRLMTFCGEPLLPRHLDAIFAVRPDLTVHNTYGPTEATVSCTLLRLDGASWRRSCRDTVALGAAIPRMGLHLVGGDDPDQGEVVLTGPQLARGYWRNPSQTAAAFRTLTVDGATVPAYHTGDWACRRDGQLYFQQRMDTQVKIRGHRIELGEIDLALDGLKLGASRTIAADGELHTFIESGTPLDERQIRAALAASLPEYAIPRAFHRMERLPRNANDKIDVLSLAERVRQAGAREQGDA